jgi:hypothetical protein
VKRELEDSKLDIEGLKQLVEIKSRELRKIRSLARKVLEQRTELEQFFLDSLEEVKQEHLLRLQSPNAELRGQSLASTPSIQHAKLPAIGTLTQSPPASPKLNLTDDSFGRTSSVNNDLQEQRSNTVNVKDLTWEEKERVLKLLFAKMNGYE